MAGLLARRRAVLAAILLMVFGALAVRTQQQLPANPHAFMDQENQCATCHATYLGSLVPHEFAEEMPPKCWSCHLPETLGRSHPIGMKPKLSRLDVSPPENLPLENEKISCGTCHNPHAVHLSRTKSYPDQMPALSLPVPGSDDEIPYYKTYYLRVSDPAAGFLPLCVSCHADL